MGTKVIVIGGGVAGMSAAHELIERDFDVEVYERRWHYAGGKARSVDVPNTAIDGRKDLPGEHGFRFFPAFYRHLTDTMKRIPVKDPQNPGQFKTAFDNLVKAEKEMTARPGREPLILLNHLPRTFAQLKAEVQSIENADIDFTEDDKDAIALTLWKILTSCWERRNEDYERQSWWDFAEADKHSAAYKTFFADGLTRTLVAAKAKKMSAKTGGDILVQLLLSMLEFDGNSDRVLNGPTNDAWLIPWLDYLKQMGVDYHFKWVAQSIEYDEKQNQVTGVKLLNDEDGTVKMVQGDYYLFAVPVESMARIVGEDTPIGSFPRNLPARNQALINAAPTLLHLSELAEDTNWMNGAQYYLNQEIPLLDTLRGHVIYSETPWALTSISQRQFWPDYDLGQYGNGAVKSILSVDISNWEAPGLNGKIANACTKEEIRDEIWQQLQQSLNNNNQEVLPPLAQVMVEWYLDRDIVEDKDRDKFPGIKTRNLEPLLINDVNTWGIRPSATTAVPNLLLSGDYVRTFTDLATMEGANEAARHAVNAILQATGSEETPCKIWNLYEPSEFTLFKWRDRQRYYQGLPWQNSLPFFDQILHFFNFFATRIGRWFSR
ncbi:MAG: FAD-dependent oxidoreductase [Cyanobacteria bacterium P01_A01_bin.123]